MVSGLGEAVFEEDEWQPGLPVRGDADADLERQPGPHHRHLAAALDEPPLGRSRVPAEYSRALNSAHSHANHASSVSPRMAGTTVYVATAITPSTSRKVTRTRNQ